MSVEAQLRDMLSARFEPRHMELDNESHMHSVPANSETHFRLVMVSDAFSGKLAVARHQAVYGEAKELLEGPIHALAMHLYDPAEWEERQADAPDSPQCLGGSAAEKKASA